MSARVWRVGVSGSSFGGTVHVPAFKAQGQFEVVALASPTNAARIARERDIPNAFSSLREMLDGVELDVVSVASPPFDHRDAVLEALARGKHVLCEKPFALDVAQAEEMLAAAQRAGTVCAIAHEFRYTPSRLAMHELIANGHLGPVRDIEYTLLTGSLLPGRERRPGWWFERARGGGITGAMLSHLIDTANWLAGREPVRSTGFERTANPQRTYQSKPFTSDVADGAFALIDYGAGAVGRVTADCACAVESIILAVHGEQRSAVISGKHMLDATMFAIDEDESSELELQTSPHAHLESAHASLPPFVTLLDEFARALDGKPADLPSFQDGLATQRVLASVGYGA